MSRREVMRRMGWASAVTLPLVTSIVAPTASQAATSFPSGFPCESSAQCCSGHCATALGVPCGYAMWPWPWNHVPQPLTGTGAWVAIGGGPIGWPAPSAWRTSSSVCRSMTPPWAGGPRHLPHWLIPCVLKQWARPCTGDHQPPEGFAIALRHPARLPNALRVRWPSNPIEATIDLKGPLNALPRLPFQLGQCLVWLVRFCLGQLM